MKDYEFIKANWTVDASFECKKADISFSADPAKEWYGGGMPTKVQAFFNITLESQCAREFR